MPPPKTTGRITRIVRRALTSLLADSYPTIDDPTSGSVVPGGPLSVTVSTNRPDLTHRVRVLTTDGSATELDNQPVTFPSGDSPGTANVTIPAAGAADTEYFIEVEPSSGPKHRIVVTVLKAGTPLAVAIDTDGTPEGTYPAPLSLNLTGAASGGTSPYTIRWLSGGIEVSDNPTLRIGLTVGGGTVYTFTCEATDGAMTVATANVSYTIT